MVKSTLLTLFLISTFSYAQELGGLDANAPNTLRIDPKVSFSATISPGKMLSNGLQTVYVNGFIEVHESPKYSFRGDIYQLASYSNNANSFLNPTFLNRLTFGMVKNFQINNIRFFGGIQGGITSCQYLYDMIDGPYRWSLSPTFSVKIGAKLLVWKYAHFFIESSYFHNYINNTSFGRLNLNEFLVSGGLGFQISK